MKTTSINIPFPGFYYSWYSDVIDSYVEQHAKHHANESDGDEAAHPPELRLSADDLAQAINDSMDYHEACIKIARAYVGAFDSEASEILGVKLKLAFEEMTSPREYNFETNRIFCDVSLYAMRRLLARSRKDGHSALRAAIEARHTSRSGFISFYDNDLDSWLAKPLEDWDHNELGTLLVAMLESADDYREDSFEMSVYEAATPDSGWHEVESAIDWPKYDAAIADMRAARLEALQADDPDFVPGPVRCEFTIDMFGGTL